MLTGVEGQWNELKIRIDQDEVLRYLGYRQGTKGLTAAVRSLLEEMTGLAHTLVEPRGIGALCSIRHSVDGLQIGPNLVITGPRTRRRLGNLVSAYTFAATIGPQLEEKVALFFEQGEYTRGTMLDSIGSAAVESLAEQINQAIRGNAATQALFAQERISPGYNDWPLQAQFEVAPLTRGREIGVDLTSSGLLLPRKSITALIGISPECSSQEAGCAGCDLIECQFRIQEANRG